MKLKIEGRWICDENGDKLAGLSVREHLLNDKYAAYLTDRFDHMCVNDLRECIEAAGELQATTVAEAEMLASFKMQLESKLHDCLMVSDKNYRQEYQISELTKQVKQLEGWLDEERVRRMKAETEVRNLVKKIESLLNESESESESEND